MIATMLSDQPRGVDASASAPLIFAIIIGVVRRLSQQTVKSFVWQLKS